MTNLPTPPASTEELIAAKRASERWAMQVDSSDEAVSRCQVSRQEDFQDGYLAGIAHPSPGGPQDPVHTATGGPLLESELSALASPPPGGATDARVSRDWVTCPICGESDMERETDAHGLTLIRCVNYACRSNVAPPGGVGEGWQPIEGAPRDTPVLVFHIQHGFRVASWHLTSAGERNWHWGPGDEPIAWQPLPAAPPLGGGKEKEDHNAYVARSTTDE
jgi:hypothetical protein